METPPLHVLLALDAQILGGRMDAEISTNPTPTEDSAGDGPGSTTSTTEGRTTEQRRVPTEARNAFDQTCIDLRLESAPEALRAALARGRMAASANDPSLLSGFPFQGPGGRETPEPSDDGAARTTTSRFWGVSWNRVDKKWQAYYKDADGKQHFIGYFDNDEEAARARDKAIRDAGLEGKRSMNAVDASGALVPRRWGGSSAVVAPDPARAPTEAASKFWGVSWDKKNRRWKATYTDADGKFRNIGYFDTQEAAAHAVNAAIRALPPDVQRRRKTNPVVDGHLVPRKTYKRGLRGGKRRREDPAAATPSTRPAYNKDS
jgi:hypothetical protein